jgi:hypothetical protein
VFSDLYLGDYYSIAPTFEQGGVAVGVTDTTLEMVLEDIRCGCVHTSIDITRNGTSPFQHQEITRTAFDGTVTTESRDLANDPDLGETLIDFLESQQEGLRAGQAQIRLKITADGLTRTVLEDHIMIKNEACNG